MLGLIMVASMVPGLLIGLRRTTAIDYDAVAYRTGAILTEDPGWPVFPPWELANTIDGVDRFGLAVSKDSPGILSIAKIETFTEKKFLIDYPNDYRERIIFGDYPYRFHISISRFNTTSNAIESVIPPVGDTLPADGSYGYIRRVVKFKNYSYATLELNESMKASFNGTYLYQINSGSETPQNFTVRLNLSELVSKSINPAYHFDPRVEPINITINNFSATLNNSGNSSWSGWNKNPLAANETQWLAANLSAPDVARLEKVRFYKNENPAALPFDYDNLDSTKYEFIIDNNDNKTLSPLENVSDEMRLIIYPGSLPLDESTILDIKFTFREENLTEPAHTLISDRYPFKVTYQDDVVYRPPLVDGWLEVAVW